MLLSNNLSTNSILQDESNQKNFSLSESLKELKDKTSSSIQSDSSKLPDSTLMKTIEELYKQLDKIQILIEKTEDIDMKLVLHSQAMVIMAEIYELMGLAALEAMMKSATGSQDEQYNLSK